MLVRGDWVEIRSAGEIRNTLDERGTLAGLPFMTEMVEHCGKRFRVFRRVEKTCVEGEGMRRFRNDDVVLLADLRCSGAAHGGCQKGCMLFWKEAWVQKCGSPPDAAAGAAPGSEMEIDLPTRNGDRQYLCQSTELVRATLPLSRLGRITVCFKDLRAHTYSAGKLIGLVVLPVLHRAKRLASLWLARCSFPGQTPDEALNLHPGEVVEVKSQAEIARTLDARGRNRGLEFTALMRAFCGRRYRVLRRVERLVLETTGEMREIRNTVVLEGSTCDGRTCFGGCPRNQFHLWREIWLRRV